MRSGAVNIRSFYARLTPARPRTTMEAPACPRATFTAKYLARAAAGVPRDLVNTFIAANIKPIRPTVLIYNCTFVCDARCEMCNNWKRGDRKSDMTLDQLDRVMNHPFWGAVENLNISGGEPTTRNDLPEMTELLVRRLPRMRKIGINTTGLTPHRAIPQLTRIVEFCADAGPARSASACRSTASATSTTRCARSSAASTRPARRSRPWRRWPRKHDHFQFGIAATIFATNMEDAQNILAWARERDLDIVFNMLRFTDAMLGNRELEENDPASKTAGRGIHAPVLPGARPGGVGAERPGVPVPALRRHDRERLRPHDAVPVPDAGPAAQPGRRRCSTARTRSRSATCCETPAEELYFKAEHLADRATFEDDDLQELPQPVPGQRGRHEAGRAVREVPDARLPA